MRFLLILAAFFACNPPAESCAVACAQSGRPMIRYEESSIGRVCECGSSPVDSGAR